MGDDRPFRILVIDDEVPDKKGYKQIEKRFPGVFSVDFSTAFISPSCDDKTEALHRLLNQRYDVVLLDFSLAASDLTAIKVIFAIRKGFRGYLPDDQANWLNSEVYIVGTSGTWIDPIRHAVLDHLEHDGIGRGLDAYTGPGRDDAQGLFEELDKFLAGHH